MRSPAQSGQRSSTYPSSLSKVLAELPRLGRNPARHRSLIPPEDRPYCSLGNQELTGTSNRVLAWIFGRATEMGARSGRGTWAKSPKVVFLENWLWPIPSCQKSRFSGVGLPNERRPDDCREAAYLRNGKQKEAALANSTLLPGVWSMSCLVV